MPALVRWPGKVKANSTVNTRLWSLDLLVAAADLAEAELPQDRYYDGKNPLPVLTGKTTHSPHASMFFKYQGQEALIWADYKILRESNLEPWKLFNLSEDISESNDLAENRPDLVKKLEEAFKLTEAEINSDLDREEKNAILVQ